MVDVHYDLTADERAILRGEVRDFVREMIDDYVDPRQWDAPMVFRLRLEDRASACIADLTWSRVSSLWREPYDSHPDEMPDADLVYFTFDELRALREDHAAFDRMAGPFRACVRSGLDMACESSCGVRGYTVGDLRAMYPEGVPSWIVEAFEVDETTFTAASSEEGVWL